MLDAAGDDMMVHTSIGGNYAAKSNVVRLCCAGREEDLLRTRSDEFCHGPATTFHGARRLHTMSMQGTGSIAILLAKIGEHLLQHTIIDPRSSVIVEVYAHDGCIGSACVIAVKEKTCGGVF